jgi:diaminopimelate epimerase
MGEPVLTGAKVPTTLSPTEGDRVIKADLEVAGRTWGVSAVSFGNPHAVIYTVDGGPVIVRSPCSVCTLWSQQKSYKRNTHWV